jgi:hypothetical protein
LGKIGILLGILICEVVPQVVSYVDLKVAPCKTRAHGRDFELLNGDYKPTNITEGTPYVI